MPLKIIRIHSKAKATLENPRPPPTCEVLKDLARPHLHHAQTINRSTGADEVSPFFFSRLIQES